MPSLVQTTKLPVSATAKFAPVMPASAFKKIRASRPTLRFRKIVDIVVAGLRSDRPRKHRRDIATQLMDRRHHDVARRFVVELLDALAEIGFDHLDIAPFEERAHVAFLGQHRLALDQRLGAARRQNVEHDLVVLGGVACPVHLGAVLLRACFELLEIVGET